MRLVPFASEHLDALRGFLDDPDVQRFTRVPVPTPADFPETWLAMYDDARRDGSREAFAALGDDGELIGLGLVPSFDREAGEAEIGYIVAPAHRRRGLATAIVRELTEWAFTNGIERCELVIDVENPASEAVAARAGYTREGTLRSIHFKGERRIDASLWSRLPSDP
jgi:RimJ/RimL family protein N-acetyltransferase